MGEGGGGVRIGRPVASGPARSGTALRRDLVQTATPSLPRRFSPFQLMRSPSLASSAWKSIAPDREVAARYASLGSPSRTTTQEKDCPPPPRDRGEAMCGERPSRE